MCTTMKNKAIVSIMAVIILASLFMGVISNANTVNPPKTATAEPTSQGLYMIAEDCTLKKDGKVTQPLPIYNINHNNYMKIRDIGYLIDFLVEYNNEKQAVWITTNKHSDGKQVSTSAATSTQVATLSSANLYVDGVQKTGLTMYNIGGNNYIKLRDMAAAVNFSCGYDETMNGIFMSKYFRYSPYTWGYGCPARKIAYVDAASYDGAVGTAGTTSDTVITMKNPELTLHTISDPQGYASVDVETTDPELKDLQYVDLREHFTWTSSDESVATVDHACVTAVGEGTATITVSIEGKEASASCKVTVIADPTYVIDDQYIQEYGQAMLKLVNELRAEEGVEPLQYTTDATVQALANTRAEELVDKYSHVRPDGTTIMQNGFGENICQSASYYGYHGINQSPEKMAEIHFKLWKNSEGHFVNMTRSQYNYLAMGVSSYDTSYGYEFTGEMILYR